MQRILNAIYVVIVVVALYLWVQQTPTGANLPKITIEMPGAQPAVSVTPTTIEPTFTVEPTATLTPTRTLTPSATPTMTPTPTPATFAVTVDAVERRISSTRKLTTVETILDVVVTFDEKEKKLGWWDGGELLVQRTTVTVAVGVDLQKVSIQSINDRWKISVPESKILSLAQVPDQPYYFSKGIKYLLPFQDVKKDKWRDEIPARVEKETRERVCQLELHQRAHQEAVEYIVNLVLVLNPNARLDDIVVDDDIQFRECSKP